MILLSQGGLQRGRGALLYVEALAQLPGCTLVFLGEGSMADEIAEAADTHGVRERVHVLPSVPSEELLSWTASADVGLCMIENLSKSYYLSLPNKLFEYFAAGLPVIGSDFPEIGAVLRTSGAGIPVSPDSVENFVAAVRRIQNDDRLRAELMQRSREAGKTYQWEGEKQLLRTLIENKLAMRIPSTNA
jgi:glycosyltransferase involved in cell wall biosynthesis